MKSGATVNSRILRQYIAPVMTLLDLVNSLDLDQTDQLLTIIKSKEQTRKHKLFIKMLERRKNELEEVKKE